MSQITSDLPLFTQAVQKSHVKCTDGGMWFTIPDHLQKSHQLVGVDGNRLEKIALVFKRCLDDLEKLRVARETTSADYEKYLNAAQAIETVLENSQSEKVKRSLSQLKSRVVALKARTNPAAITPSDQESVQKVRQLANEWIKESHARAHKSLDDRDVLRLGAVERDSAFVTQVLEDDNLRKRLFDWVLRDKIDPEPFMQFPSTCERFMDTGLSSRIGFYGGSDLKIVSIEDRNALSYKYLTLPIEGRDVCFSDDAELVEMRNGYTLTISQIFEQFGNRQWEYGNLEYFSDGIRNWNVKQFGPYNPGTGECEQIDFDAEKWWEGIPVVCEVSIEEARERFSLGLDNGQWIFSLSASRCEDNDSPAGTHGWLQVGIPINGRYRLLDFGKYIHEYPRNLLQNLSLIGDTVPGVVVYPDESIFATDRQRVSHAIEAAVPEGLALMDSIKNDILKVSNDDVAFQFLSENCMKWAWEKVNNHVGDDRMPHEAAQMNFIELRPGGFFGGFFDFLRSLSYPVRWMILTALALLIGAWRGMRISSAGNISRRVSLLSQLPWNQGQKIFTPAALFRYAQKI